MAISSSTSRNQYTANGSNTTFAYSFKVFDDDDLDVYVDNTLKSKTTDYSVTGVGNASGGNIIFTTAPANATIVTIVRDEPFVQEIEYVEGDDFPAAAHEEGLDRSLLRDLTLKETLDRALTIPVTSSLTTIELPEPEANTLLGWNGDATELVNVTLNPVTTGNTSIAGTLSATGAVTFSTTLSAGATTLGATSITGGLDNNSGGITEAGAISGATTINASGNATIGGNLAVTGTATIGGNLFTALMPKQIIISNNATDPNDDIDFSAGNFIFSDGSGIAALSAMTKRLDAAWAAGTNQGGLDTGTQNANIWYHCYAIYNPTTLVSDAIFSLSASSPTLPSGYTKYKRVGSIYNDASGNILAFKQTGNTFVYATLRPSFINAPQTAGSETLRFVDTPTGIKTKAMFTFRGNATSAGAAHIKVYSADITSATIATYDGTGDVSNGVVDGIGYAEAITNTSAQIKSNAVNISGTPTLTLSIIVQGWEDITL